MKYKLISWCISVLGEYFEKELVEHCPALEEHFFANDMGYQCFHKPSLLFKNFIIAKFPVIPTVGIILSMVH